jgi:redox-sensitive bicupin YhaK (pirin superfamily)
MTAPFAATLKPHTKDLGGFTVRRVLPGHPIRMVGPFVFFDHMGPAQFTPGHGIDVRPHPHIGLATVTYLFAGGIMHRDSLGVVQKILPGDVNWMVAGRGIVHSERSDPADRAAGHPLHGIQTWLALPKAHEHIAPAFTHHPAATLPVIAMPGVEMRLIAGRAFGETAPAQTYSDMFYLAVDMTAGSAFTLPPEHVERAVYLVEGDVSVGGSRLGPQHMAVLAPGDAVEITAATSSRVMLCGGAPMDGDRHMFWNFVASERAMIEEAKARWKSGGFDPIPGETEFIPLPE